MNDGPINSSACLSQAKESCSQESKQGARSLGIEHASYEDQKTSSSGDRTKFEHESV